MRARLEVEQLEDRIVPAITEAWREKRGRTPIQIWIGVRPLFSPIKDPLARDARINHKSRLGDAIRRLNSAQKEARIRFRRNGTTDTILWELAPKRRAGA